MKALASIILVLSVLTHCFAQNPNVNLIVNINNYPNFGYSDCWGYSAPGGREYALLGVNAGVSIVDVTDSANVTEVDFVPFVNFSWYDIKTYQNHMYVTSEGTASLLIVDLSPLPDSASVVGTFPLFSSAPHNIFIDTSTGILYGVEDFNFNPSVRIIDITSPGNPVELSSINPANNGADAHDVFVQDSVLYIAEGISGSIGIFDVSDPAGPSLVQRLSIPAAGYVHNVWVTGDNRYMVTTEETVGRTVKVWDIQDINNISLVGEYLGESTLAHNAHFKDDYLFISHYESGLKIVDVSNPSDVVEVGSYDTYPQGETPNFNGAWGVYPFARNGMIFVSDMQSGLYVVRFDSVRGGGIEGTVSDAQTGTPLADVDVLFVEANKTIQTDGNGFYSLRTFEGEHTIVFSKLGYLPDTVQISIPSGPSIIHDLTLIANLADIEVSVDSLSIVLPVNTVANMEFVISNVGSGGRLDYTIDDVNGPIPGFKQEVKYQRNAVSTGGVDFNFGFDVSRAPRLEYNVGTTLGDTIIVDPAGDLIVGSGGDVIYVFAAVSGSAVTFEFEFLNDVNTDSAYLLFSLDTDFNSGTGAFPGGFGFNSPAQNVGSEYDVLINIPAVPPIGSPPLTLSIWQGSNSQPTSPPLFAGSVSVNANVVTATIPLSAIGNDDGNMAVAGFTGHLDPATVLATSLDYMPDVGHGAVGSDPLGDLPWLSLMPTQGSLFAGDSDTVTATFDTNGLEQGGVFSGFILVTSNDPDESLIAIPVTLMTEPVSIRDDPRIPVEFSLEQNYPNPFNPTTRIDYRLPKRSPVRLIIYNILGQPVRLLVDENQEAGEKSVVWDGRDEKRKLVSSGVYIYRIEAGEWVQTRKMTLLK